MTWLLVVSLLQANVYFSSDSLIQKLKARIDAAQSSIDLCIYNCDSGYITDALIAAHSARNVRVRVITDECRLGASWVDRLRSAGIPVWTDSIGPDSADLMHNKFAVFDYRDSNPDNDWLWTGSFNVAAGEFNADNAIEIQDSGLAHAYTREFEQMWGGSDSLPDPAHAVFHTGKTDRLSRHRFVVGSDTFLVYFSPQDRPVDTLAQLVGRAGSEIGFAIYSFTYRELALGMKSRHDQGVWVGGTFDRSESTDTYSYFDSLRQWGIPVYLDKFLGQDNLLHEKIMVIDHHISVTGSANWSNAGNFQNDENSLIIFSTAIAARYGSEISARYNEAGGTYPPDAINEAGLPSVEPQRLLRVSPNPAASEAVVEYSLPRAVPRTCLAVYDVAGRFVRALSCGPGRPGASSFILHAASLAPGIYVVELRAGEQVITGRLVVE